MSACMESGDMARLKKIVSHYHVPITTGVSQQHEVIGAQILGRLALFMAKAGEVEGCLDLVRGNPRRPAAATAVFLQILAAKNPAFANDKAVWRVLGTEKELFGIWLGAALAHQSSWASSLIIRNAAIKHISQAVLDSSLDVGRQVLPDTVAAIRCKLGDHGLSPKFLLTAWRFGWVQWVDDIIAHNPAAAYVESKKDRATQDLLLARFSPAQASAVVINKNTHRQACAFILSRASAHDISLAIGKDTPTAIDLSCAMSTKRKM